MVGVSTGRYTMLSSGSTVMWVHTPLLPVHAHEPFSHVSVPNCPRIGTPSNFHSILPVRMSKARATPLTLLL
jgi:hypothetical protein